MTEVTSLSPRVIKQPAYKQTQRPPVHPAAFSDKSSKNKNHTCKKETQEICAPYQPRGQPCGAQLL